MLQFYKITYRDVLHHNETWLKIQSLKTQSLLLCSKMMHLLVFNPIRRLDGLCTRNQSHILNLIPKQLFLKAASSALKWRVVAFKWSVLVSFGSGAELLTGLASAPRQLRDRLIWHTKAEVDRVPLRVSSACQCLLDERKHQAWSSSTLICREEEVWHIHIYMESIDHKLYFYIFLSMGWRDTNSFPCK